MTVPPSSPEVDARFRAALGQALDERVSVPVGLMRLLLTGLPAEVVLAQLRTLAAAQAGTLRHARLQALLDLARDAGDGLVTLERLVAAGADHTGAGVQATRGMFDRLVRISPEASVAAYSLGDADRLAAATAEILNWLGARGLLAGRPAVLDLGCGIGRCCAALAPVAARVVGLDASGGMLAAARSRCAALSNVVFVQSAGTGLGCFRDAAFDLVLAVDVFPYLVEAGPEFAVQHIRDAARLLRAGGSLVILNYSYRGIERDRADLAVHAPLAGFALACNGAALFRLWDGAAFWLRRS